MKTKTRATQNKLASQKTRFIETARELGADEDEIAFDAKLKSIAGQKPKPEKDEAPDE